jgi:hypothetical protein
MRYFKPKNNFVKFRDGREVSEYLFFKEGGHEKAW